MSPTKPVCGLTRPHDHHVVGSEGVLVEMDGKAFGRLAHDDRLHARANRAAAELLGDAVALDQPALPLGRAAAVAAHRRHDERLRAERLQMLDRRLDDDCDIGDAAAAGGDRHALPRLDALGQVQLRQLRFDRRGDVCNLLRLERLPDAEDLGVGGHGEAYLIANGRDDYRNYMLRFP